MAFNFNPQSRRNKMHILRLTSISIVVATIFSPFSFFRVNPTLSYTYLFIFGSLVNFNGQRIRWGQTYAMHIPKSFSTLQFFVIEDRHLYDTSFKFFIFYFGRLIYGWFGQNLKTYLIKVSILIALI